MGKCLCVIYMFVWERIVGIIRSLRFPFHLVQVDSLKIQRDIAYVYNFQANFQLGHELGPHEHVGEERKRSVPQLSKELSTVPTLKQKQKPTPQSQLHQNRAIMTLVRTVKSMGNSWTLRVEVQKGLSAVLHWMKVSTRKSRSVQALSVAKFWLVNCTFSA